MEAERKTRLLEPLLIVHAHAFLSSRVLQPRDTPIMLHDMALPNEQRSRTHYFFSSLLGSTTLFLVFSSVWLSVWFLV